jgi:leucyl/phenylalanyl-tRNA---protein transferase
MRVDPDILAALNPQDLVLAYATGWFPMVEDGQLMWFSPDPRGLMPVDERFHVSRSLARTLRIGRFACTIDRCFRQVMDLCAQRPSEGTWISPEIHRAYRRLHEIGVAHSVEAWPVDSIGRGDPVGGLYGVSLGGAFFAESMFHRVTDAGKVALAHLITHLRTREFLLCDVQWTTPNLCRYGAFDLPREDYLALLTRALRCGARFAPSSPDIPRL